jgi:leader peptidase (prepilin peptidase) / N-methyltransferase
VIVVPDWIWFVFIFAFGSCVGSFLNVVIYRVPLGKSIVTPPSSCPKCGRHIQFYDNIPLLSWLILAGRCRYCKTPISPRYFAIELLTGLFFVALFYLYFYVRVRTGIPLFLQGGWFIYLLHLILLSALIASSAIDLELWVIPMSICWFVTIIGIAFSTTGVAVIKPSIISQFKLLPYASPLIASLAAGAGIGLAISWLLLITGFIKRSYESDESEHAADVAPPDTDDSHFNDRIEICKEILFLVPIITCTLAAYLIIQKVPAIHNWWFNFTKIPFVAAFFGSLWGYFAGCAVVWATRILGTLGFGKEAMGLGDVHLMGAAGAVVGPSIVIIAFFAAPFFGLAWFGVQRFFKKIKQIPYGPFLSMGIFTVMILHDKIFSYLNFLR